MKYFRSTFPDETIPIKMHMLEEHAVEFIQSYGVGFGLLGEQGSESIHARFNSLGISYRNIRNPVERLKFMVKEHLITIAPENVDARPPPIKRAKKSK